MMGPSRTNWSRRAPAATAAGTRDLPHPAREEIRLESVLHALSDPVQLRIDAELAADSDELPPARTSTCRSPSPPPRITSGCCARRAGPPDLPGTAKLNGLRRGDLDALFPGCSTPSCAAAPARPPASAPTDQRQGRATEAVAVRAPGPRSSVPPSTATPSRAA